MNLKYLCTHLLGNQVEILISFRQLLSNESKWADLIRERQKAVLKTYIFR